MRPEIPIIALAAAASALPTGVNEAERRRAPPAVSMPGSAPNLQGAPVPMPKADGEWMPKPQSGSVPKPKIPEEKPKVPEEKPKIPEEKPKFPEEKPKIPEEKPKIPEEKPKIPEEKPKVPEEKPKIPEEKPKVPGDKPKIPEEKPKPGYKPCPAPPTPEEIKKAAENADKEFKEFVKHILESLEPSQTRAWQGADEICEEIKMIITGTDHDYVSQVNIFLHYFANLRTYGQSCGEKSLIFDYLKAEIQELCAAEGCKGSDEWLWPKKSA